MWIINLLTAVPSIVSGFFGTINGVTKALSDAKIEAIHADTQEKKIAAEERVQTLQARRDLMIAEAGVSKANIIVRSILATPTAVILFKLMIWDKVIGAFAGCAGAPRGTCGLFLTDPLDENQWKIIGMTTGFYFLYEGAIGVARIIKR